MEPLEYIEDLLENDDNIENNSLEKEYKKKAQI